MARPTSFNDFVIPVDGETVDSDPSETTSVTADEMVDDVADPANAMAPLSSWPLPSWYVPH